MILFDINCVVVFLGIFRFTVTMYQTIHEPIKVAGVFNRSVFKPTWFEWRRQLFKVEQITLISDYKQGLVKIKIYSVIAKGNLYRLQFSLNSGDWILENVWIDG